ncbi:MAG: flagellar motor switch protein FliG, partial [Steroidobacteraceae bacterium]
MSETQAGRAGVDRAAILLLALGEQDAAQVLKYLDNRDVQRVGAAMAQLTGVSREEVSNVLSNFAVNVEQHTSLGVGTDDYIRNVLIAALGADKATAVIERILSGRSSRGLEALKWMEPRAVAGMLRHEHPQIIAIVLSYLESDHAAQVLMQLPESTRADVLMRVATLGGVHPNALSELDEVLEKQFASTSSGNSAAGFGGAKAAAEILNLVGSAQEGPLIAQIAKTDEALSQKLQDLMFVFEDLVEV